MTQFAPAPLLLPAEALDRLLPLHLVVTATGHIRHAGPTWLKLAGEPVAGRRLFEVFEVRRPRHVASADDLLTASAGRVVLALRADPRTELKGLVQAATEGEMLINLSFGIAVVEAVARHDLTATDFAATEQAGEMLYLAEARGAVMREALKLADRLRDAKREAEALAMSDTLTGLGNRRALDEAIARLLSRRTAFGLLHLDLDYFKDVNDTLGHAAGDAVLAEVARVLGATTRAQDLAARVGGDEFVVLFAGLTDAERLAEIGRRIIGGLEKPIRFQKRTCRISGSIGITTTAMYDSPDADRMLSDADCALFASRLAGGATVSVFGQTAAGPAAGTRRAVCTPG
jgi:diguanylate cyclase (GGDEF)-like protein